MGIAGHIVAAAHGVLQRRSGESSASRRKPEAEAAPPGVEGHRYNAFISYHRDTDGQAAPAFRTALHRFARSWYRLRVLRVFLDDASMGSGPLRSTIEEALDGAEFFVLLASPQAAESRWVNREVAEWRNRKPAGRLLLVLTAGDDLVWDEERGDFDWAQKPPLPSALRGAFAEEPRWSDLRKAKEQGDLSLRNPAFRAAVADVAASLHHRPREELEGEDVRQHKQTMWLARGAALVLVLLTVAAILAAVYAVRQRNDARAERNLATSRYLAAQARSDLDSELDRSFLLSVEAVHHDETAEARSALLAALQSADNSQVRGFLHGAANSVTVAFSPLRPEILASGNANGTIEIWNVQSGRRRGSPLDAHRGAVLSLAFSPTNPNLLVSGGEDGLIIRWDVRSGQRLGSPIPGRSGPVRGLAFSADATTLAWGGDGHVVRWALKGSRRLGKPLDTDGPVSAVAFSPTDDDVLAAPAYALRSKGAAEDSQGAVGLWHLERSRRPAYLYAQSFDVTSLAFSPGGQILATAGDSGISVHDVDGHAPPESFWGEHGDVVEEVRFSPGEGIILASGARDGTLIVWDLEQGTRRVLRGHREAVRGLSFSADGKTLASTGGGKAIVLWDVERRHRLGVPLRGHEEFVGGLAFSPDGRTLASAGADGTIRFWSVREKRALGPPLPGPGDVVLSLAFGPDGRILASGGTNKTIVLWDAKRGRPVSKPLKGHDDFVSDLAFSPDGKTLASAGPDGVVLVWNLEGTRRPRVAFTGLNDPPSDAAWDPPVAFSPDGKLLASARSDGKVVLWDVETKTALGKPLAGHRREVFSLAFSPDGRRLASGSRDRTVVLWDVERLSLASRLTGPQDAVLNIAFAPSGDVIAAGGSDGSVLMWDVESSQRLGSPLRHETDSVQSLAFSPDGLTLASGGADGTIVLWNANPASWEAHACRRANRNLSQLEWDRFVGGSYERTCPNLPPGEGAADE